MSRLYDVTFHLPQLRRSVVVRMSGNTRVSAERYARAKLYRQHGGDADEAYRTSTRFVPKAER